MDVKEKKLVAKAKTLLDHNCCGDPCDVIGGIKASLKKESLGKLVYKINSGSKGELFYVSKTRTAVKIGDLEFTEEQLQRLKEPGVFVILEDKKS
jgi:hypothetical protein